MDLDQEDAWDWIRNASPEELKELRFLLITDKLNAQQVNQIKEIAKVNLDLGIQTSADTWNQVDHMFDPTLLLFDGHLEEQYILTKGNIRVLHLYDPDYQLAFLSKIRNLQTLVIERWDPEWTGALPDDLPSLQRIVLIEPSIADLSSLGKQAK